MLRAPSTMVLIREHGPHNVAINPARSAAHQACEGAEHQPGQRLLPAPSGVRVMRRIRIAFDYPFAGGRNGARPAGRRGLGSAGSMRHANEADGHRGALIASPTPRSPRRVTKLTR